MQSGNHETYIRKYNYVDSLSCYEKMKQDILTTQRKLKKNDLSKKINLKKWVSDNLVTDYFWMSMFHFRLPLL